MSFIHFQPHKIKIKGKGSRTFQVICMEVIKSRKELAVIKKKIKKLAPAVPGAVAFDGDEEEKDDVTPSNIAEIVDIMFCVGDNKTGEYIWVEAKDAVYIGKTPMNKIKKSQ